MRGLEAILHRVLTPEIPSTFKTMSAFRAAARPSAAEWPAPIDQALAGGALADRLGYAFAAGYHAALRSLVPSLGSDSFACLCVTERGGAHPRAIEATVEADGDTFVLTGKKRWATLAGEGDVLLVAASAGRKGDRNELRLVAVRPDAPGVRCVAMPHTPFTPEIPHYEVTLDRVRIGREALIPGDGYARYVKPFRTMEDIHVSAAVAAYLLRSARVGGWPEGIVTRLTALVVTLRALAEVDPGNAAVRVAVAGALATLGELAAEAQGAWAADTEEAARWRRDLPLLQVAGAARAARLTQAWGVLASSD